MVKHMIVIGICAVQLFYFCDSLLLMILLLIPYVTLLMIPLITLIVTLSDSTAPSQFDLGTPEVISVS